jgi:hypothetical protein
LQRVCRMAVAEEVVTLLIASPLTHQRHERSALQESEANLLIPIGRHGKTP